VHIFRRKSAEGERFGHIPGGAGPGVMFLIIQSDRQALDEAKIHDPGSTLG
jgi:hypothetical protein